MREESVLTVDIDQDADVSAAHGVEHLTGNRLSEEGVVGRGHEHTLSGPLQENTPLRPPETHTHT